LKMPRYNKHEKDIIQSLQHDIELLKRRVKHLENAHTTAVHIHDKADLPASLANGMLFVATDNDFCWVRNGVARSVSGTIIP
jgi:hypothetical protein